MLTSQQYTEAIEYNTSKNGRLWHHSQLIWPLPNYGVFTREFADIVAAYQKLNGLTVDGKLGPATLSSMRAHPDTETPERLGHSNKLIVGGKAYAAPDGLSLTNYVDDDEHHFDFYTRAKPCEHLVIHESVTYDQPSTVRVLKSRTTGSGKSLGVHLIIAPDGHVSQHADLLTECVVHGNQLNRTSVGLEIVNPYTARKLKEPFTETMKAQWWTWVPKGAPKLYTLPTKAQMDAARILIPWVCSVMPDLPFTFPTKDLGPKQKKIDGWDDNKKPGPGVVAHRDYSSHADGRYVLEALFDLV